MSKLLTDIDFIRGSEKSGLPVSLIKTVAEVESAGNGFLEDGRPKMLFEGHIFYRLLKGLGTDPGVYLNDEVTDYGNVIYPEWTKEHYVGGAGEYNRLAVAQTINHDAALQSASWGKFQIMGFNHFHCGFNDVRNFVHAMEQSEGEQLDAFLNFIESKELKKYLVRHDWKGFALRYNGPGYAQNQYDVKLADAFNKYSAKA